MARKGRNGATLLKNGATLLTLLTLDESGLRRQPPFIPSTRCEEAPHEATSSDVEPHPRTSGARALPGSPHLHQSITPPSPAASAEIRFCSVAG